MTSANHKMGDQRAAALRTVRRRFLAAICCLLLLSTLPKAHSQTDNEEEYRVKLAFLYNFAQFVQWPSDAFSSPSAPLTICILGPDPFKGEVGEALRGRMVGGHPMEIKKLKPEDDPKACQMIFVRASEKGVARKILAALKGSNTLTVGETNGFADAGGLINLTLVENKLRFEINLDAALKTRLKVSAKLLALAKIVQPGLDH